MILLDITTHANPLASTAPDPADLDLWWNDAREGEFPLLGRARLAALLSDIADRSFVVVSHRESGRMCQALGIRDAMTVEIAVNTSDQVVIARAAQPWSERTLIETYTGIDHPAQEREVHAAEEAGDVMWHWVTTGQLQAGFIGQPVPFSQHRRGDR